MSRARVEKLLLIAGLAGVGIWLGSIARTRVSQDWSNWVFERKLHQQPASVSQYLFDRKSSAVGALRTWFGLSSKSPDKPAVPEVAKTPQVSPPKGQPPAPGTGDLIGRLAIPRLKMRAMVREGSGERTLGVALGHIPGTALPGQKGNVGVAGHRDALFRGLGRIKKADRIEFETLSGKYEYQVESTSIVKPQQVNVLDPGRYNEITLVTCYPFHYVGSAPDRFIVKARLVQPGVPSRPSDASPRSETALAATARNSAGSMGERRIRQVSTRDRQIDEPSVRKVFFSLSQGHSRTLVPGISMGVDWADAYSQSVDGWMWVMPDRRTIKLRRQRPGDPIVFYGHDDGKRRELVITSIGRNAVSGYLRIFG